MTDIASPVDGIGRVIIPDAAIAFVPTNSGAAAPPATPSITLRREIFNSAVIASEAKQSRARRALGARLLRRFAPRHDSFIGMLCR
jgi:hypothetical protein